MNTTVFLELKFWLLILFSLIVPGGIYVLLMTTRAISRAAVLLFGLVLLGIAGIDVYLLRSLETFARQTQSVTGSAIFASEVSLALYLFPILFAGVGVNVVSHVLIAHLQDAERKFDAAQSGDET